MASEFSKNSFSLSSVKSKGSPETKTVVCFSYSALISFYSFFLDFIFFVSINTKINKFYTINLCKYYNLTDIPIIKSINFIFYKLIIVTIRKFYNIIKMIY